ncbi:helix-turn-helix domain-containing protein [Leyella lascolaii]|uniref:helix-turn-helix domain-containing protein n=1 Tax=Leyella lascolaii TaxID=1776379 RepID=UPI00235760B0|nr:helix-turn-helix domain-containing protein [Leyella lascolaii]
MDRQNEHKLTGQPDFGRDMPNKPFLTIGEVADILQVSSRTVYNLIYKGTLRACRITYHITLITKEDFFLMIKETTYCKRSVSIFARQGKKTKKKMNVEKQEKEQAALNRQEGKKGTKGCPTRRRLIPAANYKQSVRDTFTDRESVGGDLYTMAEICQKFNYTYGRFYNLRMRYSIPCIKANATKCFPKAEVDKAMAEENERLGNNLSEHWYSCFDIMRLFGLGKTQVRRFALTHGVRTKRIHGNRLYYLKADWDAARKEAERKSASTKAKREEWTFITN